MEYWLRAIVFSAPWWFMIFFLIVPWFIWWRIVDKRRIKEIVLYGFFAVFFFCLLDNMGTQLGLWIYPHIFTPVSNMLEPYDYSVLPVIYMIIYQKYPNWKFFIIAQFAVAAVFSFILEPITIHFDIYRMINWKYVYSFLIYPIIGVLCKIISARISRIENTE